MKFKKKKLSKLLFLFLWKKKWKEKKILWKKSKSTPTTKECWKERKWKREKKVNKKYSLFYFLFFTIQLIFFKYLKIKYNNIPTIPTTDVTKGFVDKENDIQSNQNRSNNCKSNFGLDPSILSFVKSKSEREIKEYLDDQFQKANQVFDEKIDFAKRNFEDFKTEYDKIMEESLQEYEQITNLLQRIRNYIQNKKNKK